MGAELTPLDYHTPPRKSAREGRRGLNVLDGVVLTVGGGLLLIFAFGVLWIALSIGFDSSIAVVLCVGTVIVAGVSGCLGAMALRQAINAFRGKRLE